MNNFQKMAAAIPAAVVLVVLASGSSVIAQKPAAGRNAAVRAAIETGNKKFADGAAKRDAGVIATAYTTDAEAYPPNSGAVKGRPALQKLWQSVLDSGIAAIELKTIEVDSQGTMAYEVGTYAMKTKDGKVADHGKYCVVWKQVNGQWLLHRDIWSTSMPASK